MGCLGVHFALSDTDVTTLRAFGDEQSRLEHLREVIEEREVGGEWACETDKAWDAIHRSLTDGKLARDSGAYPHNHAVLGGELLYTQPDYIMSLKSPKQVQEISRALATITEDRFRTGYRQIKEKDYGCPVNDEDFQYTWENFTGLAEFYAKAAKAGRYVLFTADQ